MKRCRFDWRRQEWVEDQAIRPLREGVSKPSRKGGGLPVTIPIDDTAAKF
jgi:hypothetical protein